MQTKVSQGGLRREEGLEREERGDATGKEGYQPQADAGDDRERAFGADHDGARVVAGIVLRDPGHPVDDRARARHVLEPGNLRAHRSVPHGVRPTCVGGDHAADGRGRPRPVVDREIEVRGARLVVHRCERGSRPDVHLRRYRFDRIERGQAADLEDDLAAAWHTAAHEPGVAALGDDGFSMVAADADQLGNFRRGAWPDDGARATPKATGDVVLIGRARVGIREHVLASDDVRQIIEQGHARARSAIRRSRSGAVTAHAGRPSTCAWARSTLSSTLGMQRLTTRAGVTDVLEPRGNAPRSMS